MYKYFEHRIPYLIIMNNYLPYIEIAVSYGNGV